MSSAHTEPGQNVVVDGELRSASGDDLSRGTHDEPDERPEAFVLDLTGDAAGPAVHLPKPIVDDMLSAIVEAERRVADAEARASAAERRAAQAEELASVDGLTGAMSQAEWFRQIDALDAQTARIPRDFCVAVIDLDELKMMNDRRGHRHGDRLLRRTVYVLQGALRTGDLVARIGGDEFAVLAADHDGGTEMLVERLDDALSAAGIAASVGGAGVPEEPTLRAAVAAADDRMYAAKRRRKQHRSTIADERAGRR